MFLAILIFHAVKLIVGFNSILSFTERSCVVASSQLRGKNEVETQHARIYLFHLLLLGTVYCQHGLSNIWRNIHLCEANLSAHSCVEIKGSNGIDL